MSTKWLYALIIIGILSFFFDRSIALFFFGLRGGFLDVFAAVFTTYLGAITLIILSGIIILVINKRLLLALAVSYGATAVISSIFKILLMRIRPYVALELTRIPGVNYSFQYWNTSFFSWHAAVAVAALPFFLLTKSRWKYLWLIFIVLTVFFRVYTGVHYFTDVIFGIIAGLLISYYLISLEKRYKFGLRLLKKVQYSWQS